MSEAATLRFGADPHSPTNLIQGLSNNSWWTEAAALMSIPAGAAGRGERNGWTGDAAFASESESFDFGTGAFFTKYLEQVVDQQGPNGEVGGGVRDIDDSFTSFFFLYFFLIFIGGNSRTLMGGRRTTH